MRKWNYALDIKQYLGGVKSNEDIVKAAHGVVTELKKLPSDWFDASNDKFDYMLDDILYEFEEIVNCAHVGYTEGDNEHLLWSFNEYLDMLYDWADDKRVWLGL